MKITKAECLEFLKTQKVNGQKSMAVYRLFALTEKLKNAWTSQFFVNGYYVKVGTNSRIEGFTRREFGRMVWAKNEIKRRENAIKEWEKNNPMYIYDHINAMQALSRSPNLRSRCVRVPIITGPKPESGLSSDIPKRLFLSKMLSEKMKGSSNAETYKKIFEDSALKAADAVRQCKKENINIKFSPNNWRESGVSFEDFINASELKIKAKENDAFNKLKTEQEEKKVRDSNAELKEGDKAILSNDQGFFLHYGAELIGHEVEIVKFFSRNDIELAAVEHRGSIYCFRKSMLKPVKTERQKAIEFYLGHVSTGMVQ